jgi:DNA polymerase-3 subunit alpha
MSEWQPGFVHLHMHSQYSLVDGLIRLEPLLERARELSLPALAITEQGNLFSLVKFYRQAQQAGIKPVIGAELRILDDGPEGHTGHLLLLCQDGNGYRNLTRLITRSYTQGQVQGQPHVRRTWLDGATDGLIALSCARDGDIGRALVHGNPDAAKALLADWRERFPDRFYLELQRTGRPHENVYIDGAVRLAQEFEVPVVASNDVRFLRQSDFEAHEARVCIQQGRVLNDPRRPRHYSDQQYLKSAQEMCELFRDIPEALDNSVCIAQRCNLEFSFGDYYLPDFPVPEGHDQNSWLRHEAEQGLERVFTALEKRRDQREIVRDDYTGRLSGELDVIISMGFAGYFLIVADFIHWAKQQGIPVGPGRGSGAGSLVAYALGITELDPLQYDLLFERFLNPERVSLPDFDVDFCMERRDEVIEYVAGRYGRDHVSQIITYGSMAAKAVVRDVGRVLGHPYGFVDQIAKLIPFDLNMTLDRALEEEDVLRQRYREEEDVRALIDLARSLEGLARNAGKHAGGIVIAPRPLTEYMPLYCEQGSSVTSTQFDMGDVEAIGLVKFDFLGLRTLTIIDWAIKDVNRILQRDGRVDIHDIPLDDPATFGLIRNTDTTAVFQLESDGLKKLIKRLQPDSFDDLIALVALFRPGPLQSGMVDDFVERKHGRSRIAYPHPALEEILKPTYGVILYQEQVMQIAQLLAGYTLGAADLLRRAMGKKKPEEMAKQRTIFVEGAIANNVSETVATGIFDLMEKFAGYGFNKSHSAAYALLAYQTAWLKAHYPAAFMAAVLSSDMDNTDKIVILREEIKRMGLALLPPSVNDSDYKFAVVDKHTIRFGLGAIKGVGSSAIENILEERKARGRFTDMFEFCRRIDTRRVNKRVVEALIRSGAVDDLGPGRSTMAASLERAMQFAEQFAANSNTGQDDLFGLDAATHDAGDEGESASRFVTVREWDEQERLRGEKTTLGFYLHGHPITFFEEELQAIVSTPLAHVSAGNAVIAGYIEAIRTRPGRRGRTAEICLDDRTARLYATLYPETYQQYRNMLHKDRLVIATGEAVDDDYYDIGYSFKVDRLFSLDEVRGACGELNLYLHEKGMKAGLLDDIKRLLEGHNNGTRPVIINYIRGGVTAVVTPGQSWRVDINEKLLEDMRELLGQDNVRVEYRDVRRFLHYQPRLNKASGIN